MGTRQESFSYNTGRLRCPVCDGTGQISLDIQFLPDVDVPCPECNGSRYSKEAELIKFADPNGKEVSLPQLMAMDVQTALQKRPDHPQPDHPARYGGGGFTPQ